MAADLPEDTPPATPLALEALGRRSSADGIKAIPNAGDQDVRRTFPTPIEGVRGRAHGSQGPEANEDPAPRRAPGLDVTQPSAAMVAEFEQSKKRARRNRIIVPVFAIVGGIVLLGLVGLIIGVVRSKMTSSARVAAGTSAASAAVSAAPAASSAPMDAENLPAVAELKPCTSRDTRKRLVVGASKDVPLEVWGAPDETNLAVGFAARTDTGLGFVVNPMSISPERTFSQKATAPLKRVVPMRKDGSITFGVDVDDPGATVRDQLSVGTDPPMQLGTFKHALTIGEKDGALPEILWQLPSNDPITAMRALVIPSHGLVIVVRMGTALWMGWLDESRKVAGELSKIPGTGAAVGTPSLGWNGSETLVAFANQVDTKSPWGIRMARMAFGTAAATSFEWTFPEGGPGASAIAPSATGLPDGRWLVVWTEGKSGARDVRLQTYGAGMEPLGEAFTVSRPGSNAGQGIAAVGKSGGIVFYLSVLGQQYEVWGAAIECP